jgi:hypothetical protein
MLIVHSTDPQFTRLLPSLAPLDKAHAALDQLFDLNAAGRQCT